ncbi:hypothetical protein SKAU_G00347980 [Synaphobranchus kaupii]|uniref:Uncharacterized protein n=1 Tax=Synaphobranchus kaupii TaxID=118154 RepID=A0A9Q1EK38_SYNKA|nr:hypothetical protein SKAU_G00347980 [Synaphobranchus kaupii]
MVSDSTWQLEGEGKGVGWGLSAARHEHGPGSFQYQRRPAAARRLRNARRSSESKRAVPCRSVKTAQDGSPCPRGECAEPVTAPALIATDIYWPEMINFSVSVSGRKSKQGKHAVGSLQPFGLWLLNSIQMSLTACALFLRAPIPKCQPLWNSTRMQEGTGLTAGNQALTSQNPGPPKS